MRDMLGLIAVAAFLFGSAAAQGAEPAAGAIEPAVTAAAASGGPGAAAAMPGATAPEGGAVGAVTPEGVTPEDGTPEAVGAIFTQRFQGVPVAGVRRTPYGGLYEIQVGSDLLYTDEQVTFVLDGSLIDAQTRRDVTRERLEALSAIAFDELPLQHAIKQVKGDGSRRLAIFEDPNCGYCKQMRHTLEKVDDITLYTFMLPILSQDSQQKVRDVWCAANPGRAWDDWMLRGKVPARAQCDHPADEVLALAQKLMVRGTPAIFFADGTRASGAIPEGALRERLK